MEELDFSRTELSIRFPAFNAKDMARFKKIVSLDERFSSA